MAVGTGITEIADSEDESPTSSPVAVSDAAADKLSATACQDAQAVASPYQETVDSIANEASSRTNGLGVDQEQTLSNVKTTQIDDTDLQPAPQAETNISSTCIREDRVHASTLPSQVSVAVVCASHQPGSIDADGADGETSTAQDSEHVQAAGASTQHYELKPSPTDTQINAEGCDQDKHQLVLRESLSSNPTHVGIEQGKSPQDEANGNRLVVFDPGSNDLRQLDSEQPETCQGGTVMNHTIELGDTNSEALAGVLQHDVAQKTSVELPVFMAAERPIFNMDTSRATSHTGDASDSMDLDQTLAITDLATPHTEPVQDAKDIAATRPDLRNLDQIIIQNDISAAAPVSPTGANPTSSTNGNSLGLNDAGKSPGIIASQSKTRDVHEPQVEKQADNNTTHKPEGQDFTINANPLDQASAAPPAEQRLEQVHATEERSVKTEGTHTYEQPAPSRTAIGRSPCENDTKDGIDSNATPLAPATQKQSQVTASQVGEPASPCPAVRLTPQEITLAELKAQKAALLASLGALPAIQVLIEESQTSDVAMSDDDDEPTDTDITTAANKMVKEHIKLLHEYNELKDVGQGLMGLIADQRGVRIAEVQDEFGIDAND